MRKASSWLLAMFLLLASVSMLAGCNGGARETPKASSASAEQEYDIKGKVVSIGSDRRSVTLDHEDIPGLMKGMEMRFQVDDPSMLEGIDVGSEVDGRLGVHNGSYTIIKLQKQSTAGAGT